MSPKIWRRLAIRDLKEQLQLPATRFSATRMPSKILRMLAKSMSSSPCIASRKQKARMTSASRHRRRCASCWTSPKKARERRHIEAHPLEILFFWSMKPILMHWTKLETRQNRLAAYRLKTLCRQIRLPQHSGRSLCWPNFAHARTWRFAGAWGMVANQDHIE